MSGFSKLEKTLEYTFQNGALLEQALTHRSHSAHHNERLEFLGDSILNFVVASKLFEHFPKADEGQLSRLRARLVKQETLAEIARELDLGSLIRMGSGERKSGGFERDSILSDVLEAILGAVLIDSDTPTASSCIDKLFISRIEQLDAENLTKDAKSRLQELLQGMGSPVPKYVLLKTTGKSPNQEFEIACRCDTLLEEVRATGTSRRKAEQNAAAKALALLEPES